MGMVHVNKERLQKLKRRRIISFALYISVISFTTIILRFGIISLELDIIIIITALSLFLIYLNFILQKQFTKCFHEDEQETQQTKDSFRVQ